MANFLPGFHRRLFISPRRRFFFESSALRLLPTPSISYCIRLLRFSPPRISMLVYPFKPTLQPMNIHGAQMSLYLGGALKVILLKALLSVSATSELKVLICIHKTAHRAVSSIF